MVAILYTRKNSIYKKLEQDCYDISRDARTFKGGKSIIAHPPCRGWGKYSHMAKPRTDEPALAIHSIIMVRLWGGIVEHPRSSKLWKAMNLPMPGQYDIYGGWTLCIDQKWFGHRANKTTFLYIRGIKPKEIPGYMVTYNTYEKEIEKMGRAERERTPLNLAIWLIATAMKCNKNLNGEVKQLTWTQIQEK